MERTLEFADPITREAIEFMLAHIVRRQSLFLMAKPHLKRTLFDSQAEYAYGVIWETAVEIFDNYGAVTSAELLATQAMTKLHADPMLPPDAESTLLAVVNYMWATFANESEFSDDAAAEFLRSFLRERIVANSLRAVVGNAYGRVPADLAQLINNSQDQLLQIDTIQEVDSTEIIPEQMVPRESSFVKVGVSVIDDRMDGGSKPGEVHVVLAPTGVGKTMLAVEITGARAKAQIDTEHSRPMSGKTSVLFSFEGDSVDEPVALGSRMMCYAAEIDKSRIEHMRDYSTLSRTGCLLEYEQQRFRGVPGTDKPIPGEYERLMEARQWVNKFVHIADFSMSRRGKQKPRGAGGIPEMQQYLDALVQKNKRQIGTVVIDWAGQCVMRQLQMSGRRDIDKGLSLALMNFVDEVRSQIASRFNCDVWIMHQLNGEANSKSPSAALHHSMAMWCSGFATNAWFAFVLGVKDKKTSTCMLWSTKTRRGEGKDGTLCLIDGAFGRLVSADKFRIDSISGQIVTAEEAQRLQLSVATPAGTATNVPVSGF